MKTFIIVAACFLAGAMGQVTKVTECAQKLNFIEGAENFKSMDCTCIGEMRRQIQKEMEASITYLAMAAHFSQDTVNRPGFANFFFNSASEEREHSMKLIDYLLMRGEPSQNLTGLISVPKLSEEIAPASGQIALTNALKLETEVTDSIREVIKVCENEKYGKNHYHLVDYLTAEFLEEQYKGQRELAEKIKTLEHMWQETPELSEFLFDKTLL